jgi:hypothetical protein
MAPGAAGGVSVSAKRSLQTRAATRLAL